MIVRLSALASETARVNGVGNRVRILQRHNDDRNDDCTGFGRHTARPVRILHRMITVDDFWYETHHESDGKANVGGSGKSKLFAVLPPELSRP